MILDEVHERNIISDFLTIIMRDLLPKRCVCACVMGGVLGVGKCVCVRGVLWVGGWVCVCVRGVL